MNAPTLRLVFALLLTFSGVATAQNAYQWESFDKRVTSAQTITALGNDLFGDNISLQTGALSFTTTDVDLPGNSGLPVRFTRSYSVSNSRGEATNRMLADWSVQVPRLTARFAAETPGTTEWRSGGNSLDRCSNQTAPDLPASLIGIYTVGSFWQGIQLDIPGVASGELLVSAAGIAKPSDGEIWRWTTDGQIQLRCITSIANGTGQGFIAITPDGTEYRFDRMAKRSVPGLYERRFDSGGAGIAYGLTINEHSLYASKVTDRFGNSVEYIYTNTANEPGRLTTIRALLPGGTPEGRQIDITYGTNGKVQTVSDGTHTWTYGYGTDNSPNGRTILASVLQPDGRSWIISFAGLSHSPIVFDYSNQEPRHCLQATDPQNLDSEPTGTITHPSGAVGTFRIGLVVHARENVNAACDHITGPVNNTLDDDPLYVQAYYAWSLLAKTITGPGLDPLTWSYVYDSSSSPWFLPGVEYNAPVCNYRDGNNVQQCDKPQCTSGDCLNDTDAYTTVTAPDGTHTRYTFGNSWQYNEGKLLKVEHQNSAGVALETTTHRYDLTRLDTPTYPAHYGTSLRINADGFDAEFHRPKLETITNRDGIDFKGTVDTCSGFPCLDSFARPTKVTRSSTLPFSKQETYSYFDQSTEWVLGQLATTHVGATLVAQATYDPNTALMATFSSFGQLQQSLTYHGDGNVQTVTDALLRTTSLTNWKRGIPQTIQYHDGTSISATVNDFGWITSTTNEMGSGYTTSYGHDLMGRVTSLTHPGADTVAWSPTSIVYEQVPTPQFSLPNNLWRRQETTGARITETYFDALWRPILERRRTTDASAGERFIRKKYDHDGRTVFTSYPVASVTNYTTLNTGSATSYDVLGRVTSTLVQSELGDLTTSTLYLSPFRTQYKDARDNITTTTYQAFDAPSYDAPMQTTGPEGVTTAYTRDVFGKPLTLTRSGIWFNPTTNANELASGLRRFVYDTRHRLCKTIEPDAGITVTNYDDANNVQWRALGQNTLTSTSDCQQGTGDVPLGARSQYGYDARGRVLYIDHPTGTDDVGYTYFADGAMQTASTGTLTTVNPVAWSPLKTAWTYSYNKRRLLESESLAVDSKTFLLDWSYNPRGDVSGLIYPSTHSVGFDPNAYGEPRQVRNLPSGTFYASSATYNPFGGIAGFTYGSAATRAVTPNLRGLPSQILDMKSGARRLDHQLSYDQNANLAGIIDGRDGLESRTLAYDARNRLTSITGTPGSIGNESFTYDTLDNVRRAVGGGADRRFHYNASTLRLSQITTINSPNVMDYAWNDRGEQTSRTHTEPGSPPLGPDVIFLNGFEEATISSTETFAFDQASRLVTTFGQMTHTYDAHNHRVSTVTLMTGTRYQVYSQGGDLLYIEDSGSNQRTEFFHLGSALVAERTRPLATESPIVSYLHSDHRGTPSVKTDSNSVENYRSRLMPYGAPYDNNWREGPGFAKHATDEAAQLSYMQQRYYDPVSMRFLSPDPVDAGPESFNVYAYANNNPYTLVDPDGRQAMTFFEMGFSDIVISKAGYNKWKRGELTAADAIRRMEASGYDYYVSTIRQELLADAKGMENARRRGVSRAWADERDLLQRTGVGTRDWSDAELEELSKTGKVKGYAGHHINNVQAYPELADEPDNVRFYNKTEHTEAHVGGTQRPTSGQMMNRRGLRGPSLGELTGTRIRPRLRFPKVPLK